MNKPSFQPKTSDSRINPPKKRGKDDKKAKFNETEMVDTRKYQGNQKLVQQKGDETDKPLTRLVKKEKRHKWTILTVKKEKSSSSGREYTMHDFLPINVNTHIC